MLDQYQPGLNNPYASREVSRAVLRVADLVPSGSLVTIEGTPLYAGQPWDESHEFGFNGLLALQLSLLRDRGYSPLHIAMVDDYTTDQETDVTTFTRQMRQQPDITHFESYFADEAEARLQHLRDARRTMVLRGELRLMEGSQPRLRVQSGRVSCELLDACFQLTKGTGIHIIIHPTEFVSQQQGMREILSAINGDKLPGIFINIFFKRNVLSRILLTDHHGRTRTI